MAGAGTVADASQGVQRATCKSSPATGRANWRKCEAKLNALPNFMTEIDGLDIRFIHVRSKHQNALPLVVTHGWPGSVVEQLKIIDPLTNPTAHGRTEADAFHVVIPSMLGYGFSEKPPTTALALGAKACFVGRAWAYALGAGGEPAVARMLQTLRAELEVALILTGCFNARGASLELLDRAPGARATG